MTSMRVLTGMATCLALCLALVSVRGEDLAAKSSHGKDLLAAGRFEEAIPVYRELVTALPNDPGPLMNLGLALHMAGQEREAITQFKAVLRLDPNHHPAQLFLGAAYLGLKAPAEAVVPLGKVVRAQPNNKEARLLLGETLLSLEQFESAVEQFERLSELDAENPKAWNGLGLSYEGLAGRNFVELERIALGSAYWLVLFAEARATAGYFTRAFLLYREAQAKMPTMRGIHKGIADVYRRIGKPEWAAIEEEKERRLPVLDCSPADGGSMAAPTRFSKNTAVSSQREARPLAKELECEFQAGRYKQVLTLSTGFKTPEAYFWRTRAYNELARGAFSRLAQMAPSAEVHELLAVLHFNRRKYHEAAKEWQEALKFSPGNPYYRRRLAISLSSNNEFKGAVKVLESLIQRSPDSLELNYWLGHTILEFKGPEEAIPYLLKALEADPTVPAVHKDLARAYMQAAQTEKAIPHLKAALPADEDGSVHYQLSVAYRRIGQPDLAKKMLEKFRELDARTRGQEVGSGERPEITPP